MTLNNSIKENGQDKECLKQEMLKICQMQDVSISSALLDAILKIEEKYYGDEARRRNQLWELLNNENYIDEIINKNYIEEITNEE